ncbi:hypothetical protein FA048_12140 [Pedobacter polaris]|uniref:Uncharacterized protein n=1 Tax=Pedobacter polaris TaxID=2571273 RepID=A0A4U1CJW9_9SPHI|nr:hypothetical protein [Pedobacter polaris]TKC07910.1 hypothetical protein FA048_12140 [Pedobacter polaris]
MNRLNFFNPKKPNSGELIKFIEELNNDKSNYLNALRLSKGSLREVPFEMLMQNSDDIADGVNKVEVIFERTFFGIFKSLHIKHNDKGETQMMFYEEIENHHMILELFSLLKNTLGGGVLADHKFSSFNDIKKVAELAKGRYKNAGDELLHLWDAGEFMVTLNYKLNPLRQLLLSFRLKKEKILDAVRRENGTLIQLLKHSPRLLDYENPLSEKPTFENEKIKFIDYEFELIESEFEIFNRLAVRLFSDEKEYNTSTHTLLTYYSTNAIDLSNVLILVDELELIYGADSYGQEKLEPHNVDDIRNNEFWSGKTWYMNHQHAPWDLEDEAQKFLYSIILSQDPEDLGLKLEISAYDNMEKYEIGLI